MRQTQAEIDTTIVDTAAWLFSAQGFDRTSVQQIADAVGYSKTGLLHRFPSKQALRDAADVLITTAIDDIFAFHATTTTAAATDATAATDETVDERRQLLSKITETALQHPGTVQYLLQGLHAARPEEAAVLENMNRVADRLIEILVGVDADEAARFRGVLALDMICSGIVIARKPEHPWQAPDLGPLLVRLAESVIDTR